MNLKAIRKAKSLTQMQLAGKVGIDQSTISKFEAGGTNISLHTLMDICQALDITLADLFADDRSGLEQIMLNAFRSLPEGRQQGWIDMARQVLRESEQANGPNP